MQDAEARRGFASRQLTLLPLSPSKQPQLTALRVRIAREVRLFLLAHLRVDVVRGRRRQRQRRRLMMSQVEQVRRVRPGVGPGATAAAAAAERGGGWRGRDHRGPHRVVLRQAAIAATSAEHVPTASRGRDGDRGRGGPRGVAGRRVPRRRRRAVGLLSLRSRRGVVEAVAAVELRLVLLLPLHAPVLEPDLDLTLRETQSMGNLDPSPACEVPVKVELLLQLQGLITGIGLPPSFPF